MVADAHISEVDNRKRGNKEITAAPATAPPLLRQQEQARAAADKKICNDSDNHERVRGRRSRRREQHAQTMASPTFQIGLLHQKLFLGGSVGNAVSPLLRG